MTIKNKENICKYFAESINPNLLGDILDKIYENSRLENRINDKLFPFMSTQLPYGHVDLDYFIALNVTAIHWYYKGSMDSEPIFLQSSFDDDYKTKIVECFFNQSELYDLIDTHDVASRFSYVPIVFATDCLCGEIYRLLEKFKHDYPDYKNDFTKRYEYGSLFRSCQRILSIGKVIRFGDLPDSLSLFRTLVEGFFTYAVLKGNDEAIKEYYKLISYKLYNTENGKYPDECTEEAKNLGFDTDNDETSIYVNYGWLHVIDKNIKKKRYSFDGIAHYAKKQIGKETSDLASAYHLCNSFVHADTSGFKNDWVGFCYLYNLVSVISMKLSDFTKDFLHIQSIEHNNFDLQDKLSEEIDELHNLMIDSGDFCLKENKKQGK